MPLLTHEREKRVARSIVRQRLAEVEQARWADGGDETEGNFDAALTRFEAEAVTAGITRSVVDLYVVLAEVSFCSSLNNVGTYEDMDGPRSVPFVPVDLAALVEAACELVVDEIWRPMRSTLTRRIRVAAIKRTAEALSNTSDAEFDWSPWRARTFPRSAQLRDIRKRAIKEKIPDSVRIDAKLFADWIVTTQRRKAIDGEASPVETRQPCATPSSASSSRPHDNRVQQN